MRSVRVSGPFFLLVCLFFPVFSGFWIQVSVLFIFLACLVLRICDMPGLKEPVLVWLRTVWNGTDGICSRVLVVANWDALGGTQKGSPEERKVRRSHSKPCHLEKDRPCVLALGSVPDGPSWVSGGPAGGCQVIWSFPSHIWEWVSGGCPSRSLRGSPGGPHAHSGMDQAWNIQKKFHPRPVRTRVESQLSLHFLM